MTNGLDLGLALAPLRNLLQGSAMGMLCRTYGRYGFLNAVVAGGFDNYLDDAERLVFRLFFQHSAITTSSLTVALGEECVSALASHGVLVEEANKIRTAGYGISTHFGFYLLSGADVHLAWDSLTFGDLLHYAPGRSALDLCTGSAILSMVLARGRGTVIAVETIETTCRVAKVNVALAGLQDQIEVRHADLFEGIGDRRFDLIVANPPFSPSLEGLSADPIGAGGADGLAIARTIVANARGFLNPGGSLILFLGMLGDECHAFFEDELSESVAECGWRVKSMMVQEPRAIAKVNIPTLEGAGFDTQTRELRTRQIAEGASRNGATHYHVATLILQPDVQTRVTRVDWPFSKQEFLVAGIKERRRARQSRQDLGPVRGATE